MADNKQHTLQHRCRTYFETAYEQKKGEPYYYAAKDAAALKGILNKIKFLMPEDEKNDEQKLETNFQVFTNAIMSSMQKLNVWVYDNLSLPIINSKFNEIYSQLKNGRTKPVNTNDVQRVFGSRNITPDILDIFT